MLQLGTKEIVGTVGNFIFEYWEPQELCIANNKLELT